MSGPYKLTGRETSYMPQLTIVILQYRPDAAALRRTLASLAMQDTRDFAVVLGDDGSQQDYFAESRAYLAAHGITDVQTAKLIPNGGTVKNAQNALRTAATRWVLMLSPGDFLYDSETVSWWLGRLQADGPRVAFGKQAYFIPGPAPQPTPGETPFDRTPYDPAHYDAKTIRRAAVISNSSPAMLPRQLLIRPKRSRSLTRTGIRMRRT